MKDLKSLEDEVVCIEVMCTYVTSLILYLYMDRFSFQEAVLADYIQVVSTYSRKELLSELLDVKSNQLEQLPDDELIVQCNVQRRKQKS